MKEIISEISIKGKIIRLVRGDITESNVDVIVNAANSYLRHGGGLAAAIVRKGGKIIQEDSDKIGIVPIGNAVITGSGTLPCKVVTHTVGPKIGEGKEDQKKICYEKCFNTCSSKWIQKYIYSCHKLGNIWFS